MEGMSFALYLAVAAIGASGGMAELLSRYRDAPWAAVFSQGGIAYTLINAAVAILALAVLPFPDEFTADGTIDGNVLLALTAGLGGLALIRAKLVTVKVAGNDVALGPALILDTLLAVVDRQVDRTLAEKRLRLVGELMVGISFEKAAFSLTRLLIGLLQNISAEEQQRLSLAVEQIRNRDDLNNRSKCLELGLLLLEPSGAAVLRQAVGELRDEISLTRPIAPVTAEVVHHFDFGTIRNDLALACMEIAELTKEERYQLETQLIEITGSDSPYQNPAALAVLLLERTVGSKVLADAIALLTDRSALPDGALLPPAPPPEAKTPAE